MPNRPIWKHSVHKLVVRKSPFSERETEVAITIFLLLLTFAASSSSKAISYPLAMGATLVLGSICVAYIGYLRIRNERRKIPFIVDTGGRWTCDKKSIEEVDSYLDYYCEIPRDEHRKGPMPRVSILDRDSKSILSDYIIRPNEEGDVRIYFHPRRTDRISSTPPVKLAITGKS